MSGTIIGILIALAFAGVVAFLLLRKKKKKQDDSWKQSAETRAARIRMLVQPATTPAGWKVYFESGADPSVFSLPACDIGVEKTFQKGECAGYVVERSRHQISIVVFNSIPDSQGDPAYKVFVAPGNPYYGSEWDKEAGKGQEVDHYILAAGQTVGVGEPAGDIICIPHHSGKEAHLSTVVEYEMEHVMLAWHDGPKFEETKTHGSGQGHPLIPDCPEHKIQGFASRPFTGLCVDAKGVTQASAWGNPK